ncbi:MAG: hypothetical protein ACLQQ4_17725 [Bacteroidia bacterium]
MQPTIFETKYADYQIEDGIMIVTFASNLVISLDIAKKMMEDRVGFSNGITMPFLVDIRGLASIDTISRKYFTSEKALLYGSASALLVESEISKLAGKIYISVDKPRLPVKLFTDKKRAIKWLNKFKK